MSHLPRLPAVGTRVDRYVISADIAHGGMAAVYAVRRVIGSGFDKLLAMKVLLPHLSIEQKFLEMFVDEVRIVSRIDHPNVVQVFDTGHYKNLPFLVMEYLSGQSLSAINRRCRERDEEIPPGFVYSVLADAARGLGGAHETTDSNGEPLDLVHRDVSPQNIHVGYSGIVKVVDFGIASARGRVTATVTGELKGKIAFMAPEQVMSRDTDRRTDIWALGVLAYESIAGTRLFRADSDGATIQNILNKEVPEIGDLGLDLPQDLADTIMACLERTPAARPRNAKVLAAAFGKAAMECGAWTPEKVSDFVTERFVAERTLEQERISAALRSDPPPPLASPETSSGVAAVRGPDGTVTTPYEADLTAPSRRTGVYALAGLGALAVAGVLAFSISGTEAVGEPREEPASALEPVSTAQTEPPPERNREPSNAPEPTATTFQLDPTVSALRFRGTRFEEREVSLVIPDGEEIEVELIDENGRSHRRVLGASDSSAVLRIEGRTPRHPRRPGARMTMEPTNSALRPYPYGNKR